VKVYVLEHKDPAFAGVLCGVDFYGGRGSTSSPHDVVKLIRAGCRLTENWPEIRALAASLGRLRRKRAEEEAKLAAFERTPEFTARALERQATFEAAEKRKHRVNKRIPIYYR